MSDESRTIFDNMDAFYEMVSSLNELPEDEREDYFMGFINFITSLTV